MHSLRTEDVLAIRLGQCFGSVIFFRFKFHLELINLSQIQFTHTVIFLPLLTNIICTYIKANMCSD